MAISSQQVYRFEVSDDYPSALQHLASIDYPVVIKASGLAAGKGVLLPETNKEAEQILHMMMEEKAFGEAGNKVMIEERLSGPEVFALAFSDGKSLALMPCAQDHKRFLDDDLGPNTGGMGTFAPAPILDDIQLKEIEHSILLPAIDGLRAIGNPCVDIGPVLAQSQVIIQSNDTLEELEKRIHQVEHFLLVNTLVQLISEEEVNA